MAVWPGLFGRIQLSKKTDVKIDNLGNPALKQESNFFFNSASNVDFGCHQQIGS